MPFYMIRKLYSSSGRTYARLNSEGVFILGIHLMRVPPSGAIYPVTFCKNS